MGDFSSLDLAAVVTFLVAWIGYSAAVEKRPRSRESLNQIMNRYRHAWTDQLAMRENRVVDTTINASLQNGTAFFASTSLIALGSVLTLTRSADDVLTLFATLPFGMQTTRTTWEIKVAGLALIFVYAFFKFAWAYRLFNYGAILIGAVPPRGSDPEEIGRAAGRAARMNVVAGGHFNHGQRAFFFALAYLGWFVSPYVLFATTAAVVYVMGRRQFTSDALRALQDTDEPGPPR
ncbi:DUF599 domain-containing protein [Methylobacterium nodulans]|uniref:DUF599 domain-containing protein n=1 Tax=Methylobacterium nodulans (strain LMG 21967 / CNCM I-2342 / ORS 2060) TaxID=460265 RepID=B8IS67_METNO|nr:DUF599 family protein [Methylobacterium nodulans]ACL56879.1 protein of unknown function DUF599 [Methylobacterium nodulans ORS 2060]